MVIIPQEKLEKLQSDLSSLLQKKKIMLRELESITGLMSFCSRAIPSSRAFIRRFYDLIASVKCKKHHYKVRLNKEVKADAMLWLQFLNIFNGQCFFPERVWLSNDILQLFTDSSGNQYLGCGAFFNDCVCKTRYELSLFKAAFSLAFHGLFRVGELVVTNSLQSHTLQLSDIHILNGLLQVCIPSSKTDQLGKGSNICIYPQLDLNICPVNLVSEFIKSRPPVLGPLFCHFDGSPLSRYQFVTLLKKAIDLSGIDQTRYSSHSFRIGAATTLSMDGVSDSEIMRLGRWSSNAYKGIVGDPVNVWIVGSSIVKHAFVTARDRPGGVNLGLGRLNASFWWQGKGGMIVRHVKAQLRTMKKYEDPPQFLLLHVGGNDLGNSKVGFLRNVIKDMIRWIMKEFPTSKLVWSQILTRLKWRYSNDHKAMDLCRYRINNSIAAFIVSCGGYYIKHPDIHADQKFFQSDGVHLSSLGNELWLNILQGAMEHFIQNKDCASTFPC
ncbi:unnamed protein product [Mytilus edulis]|uniref:Tyr recombinase domain-containing protein n=1 Tax=Mytilus edulis TaxID=6550 RepID=A0A8S3TGL6_MYTED|nr:unnamed protein product [Mytilus edulis]